MEIYGQEGYYIEWTTEVALLFAKKVGLGGSAVSEIVEASVRRGMFDKELFEKYHVLTSKGIQKRYFEAVSRRKEIEVDENILLVDVTQICSHVNIKRKNADISSKNADSAGQSKVEKSRGKKSREERVADKPPSRDEVRAYASERNSGVDPDRFFDYFDAGGWVDSKGNPVRNWKQKFITWENHGNGGAAERGAKKPTFLDMYMEDEQ